MEEMVEIVDENNKVVKVVPRGVMRRERLPHRASYIAVCNSQNRFLVELRTLTKDYAPGLFDACVGGVVSAGEDPKIAAARELLEEVGLAECDIMGSFHYLGEFKIPSPPLFVFGCLFFCRSDGITVRQESEVSGIMYLKKEDLDNLRDNFAPDSYEAFNEILKRASDRGLL